MLTILSDSTIKASRTWQHQCLTLHPPPYSIPHFSPRRWKRKFSSVQSLSHVQLFATPWTVAHQASMSITNSQSLLKLMSIELMMPSNHLILFSPLLFLPSIFPSIRVLSNESVLCIRWPKNWSFQWIFRKIFFRIDWLDLLALHESSPKHSSKASVLQCSDFFIVQTSQPFMTTGKAIALTRQNFVSRVMSLLFNMLSRISINFLPRIKHLLIHGCSHYLQSFWSLQNKVCHCFHVSPFICHEVMGPDTWSSSFEC